MEAPTFMRKREEGRLALLAKQAQCKVRVIKTMCGGPETNELINDREEPRNRLMHLSKFDFGQRRHDRECGKGKVGKTVYLQEKK